jgi:hypothetical protein
MGGAASTSNDDFHAAGFGARCKLSQPGWRSMRGDNAAFVRDPKPCQDLVGMAHSFPVRLAAHDHRY